MSNADVIVSLDTRNLYAELTQEISHYDRSEYQNLAKTSAKIVRIDSEEIFLNSWITDSGRIVDSSLTIIADSHRAVKKLIQLCEERISPSSRHRINERIVRLTSLSSEQRIKWSKAAEDSVKKSFLNYASLSLLTWDLIKGKDWVVSYAPRELGNWLRRIWKISNWDQYAGLASGTGCGIGRAIGVTLANRGRLSINFQTDGDILYSSSALWTISHIRLPMLIVMVNNHSYYNDEKHQLEMAIKRERPVSNKNIGIRIEDPFVDFSHLAAAFGIRSSGQINSLDRLKASINEGIRSVLDDHEPYLVDTCCRNGIRINIHSDRCIPLQLVQIVELRCYEARILRENCFFGSK